MSNQGRRGSLSIVLGGIMVAAWITGCEYGGEPTTGCQTDNDCAEVFAVVDQCEKAVCHKLTRVCIKLAREDGWGCDDQNACTGPDSCQAGACVGASICQCTQDEDCPMSASPCDGVTVCRMDHTCGIDPDSIPPCDDPLDPPDPCRQNRCVPSPEQDEGWECAAVPANDGDRCDDSDECTQVSSCMDGECVGEDPVDCDDSDGCTLDFCHPEVGCVYIDRSCDDDNACTLDWCQDGECMHEDVVCESDNTCLLGECDATVGRCLYQSLADDEQCDDGIDCTIQDRCVSGVCQGDATPQCPENCDGLLSPRMYKMTTFFVSSTGMAYPDRTGWPESLEPEGPDGLDVDRRADTCAPWVGDGCDSGIDNAMGPIGSALNIYAQEAIESGDAIILFDANGFDPDQPFVLGVYEGVQAASDGAIAVSDYGLDSGCGPRFKLQVVIDDGRMVNASDVPASVRLHLPMGPHWIPLTLKHARIDALVATEEELIPGKTLVVLKGMKGIIAGAVPKHEIVGAVEKIPNHWLPDSITVADLKALVEFLIAEDIDTDGDGFPDAVSCAIHFAAEAQDVASQTYPDPRSGTSDE